MAIHSWRNPLAAVEQCAVRHQPIGMFAPASPAAKGFRQLWIAIERELTKQKG